VCIDSHQTGFIGKGSDPLQLIKFWPSSAPGNGSVAERKFFVPPYYGQRAVFASPLSAFSFTYLTFSPNIIIITSTTIIVIIIYHLFVCKNDTSNRAVKI